MKRTSVLIALVAILVSCKGENQDKKSTGDKAVKKSSLAKKQDPKSPNIKPVEHASFVLEQGDKTLYFDPVGGAEKYSDFPAPDRVLITHSHPDHFSVKTLKGLMNKNATLIAPKSVASKLPDNLREHTVVMANNDKKDFNGLTVKAIPMYNLPAKKDAFHPKGKGNSYLLTTANSMRIYISGDTEDIPALRHLENIDMAFVCMNQPYTMTVEQAADAVLDFQPKTVYPYHFRGKDEFSDVDKFKTLVEDENSSIDVKILNWYPDREE